MDYEVLAAKPMEIVLHGHINTIRRGIAYVTLKDEWGHESFAECKLAALKADGVVDRFAIVVTKRGEAADAVDVTIRAAGERQLSATEWRYLSETMEQAFRNDRHTKPTSNHHPAPQRSSNHYSVNDED